MTHQICDSCETVAHCMKSGCVPLQPAQTDWEAVAADQAMTIAMLKSEQQAEQQKKYWVGDLTLEYVFKPAGLENLSNLQAVLNQMEKALTTHPLARKPLTLHEIVKLTQGLDLNGISWVDVIRAVEAAHGIVEKS